MDIRSRIATLLAPPIKRASSGSLVTPGEVAYDDVTGIMRYRDAVSGIDRSLAPRLYTDTIPFASAYSSTDNFFTPTASTWSPIPFNANLRDTASIHSTGVNTSRFVAPQPGIYHCKGLVWFPGTPGAQEAGLRVNGSAQMEIEVNSTAQLIEVSKEITLNAGDYVELCCFTTSTTALRGGNIGRTQFQMTWQSGNGPTVTEVGVSAARASVGSGGTQSIPLNSAAVVLLPNEDYDTDGIHDTTTNTSRLTARTAGVYTVAAMLTWAAAPTGITSLTLLKNGAALTPTVQTDLPSGISRGTLVHQLKLAAGDYVELRASTDAGGARVVDTAFVEMALVGSGKTVIPRARVFRSTALSPASATWTKIPLDTVENGLDNDGMFDAANGRLSCKTAGTYALSGNLIYLANASGGNRIIALVVNGVIRAAQNTPATAAAAARGNATCIIDLAVGDYVELWTYQDSGGALALTLTDSGPTVTTGNAIWLTAAKVGQSGPGANNDPGWAVSGTNLQATNSGDVIATGVFRGKAIAFSAYRNGTQALTAATPTKVQLNTEETPGDSHNFFDSTTNFRFQPTVAGWYDINGAVLFPTNVAGNYAIALLYKNGAVYKRLAQVQWGGTTQNLQASGAAKVYLNGSTDYVELWANSTAAVTLAGAAASDTYMQGVFIGT